MPTYKTPLFSAVALLAALLACGGSKTRCIAAIDVGGDRSYSIGTGSSRAEAEASAKRGACMAHCKFGSNRELETAYQAWRASAPGQAQGAPRDKGVAIESVPALKQIHKACIPRCNALVTAANTRVQCN